MGQDRVGHTATLKLTGQRPTTHYTLDKLRDLVMGETACLGTMECSSLLQTGIMMPRLLTVQAPLEVVDGGIITAILHS